MTILSSPPAPNYLEWIQKFGDPSNQRLLFGFMPAYPIFMFSGILLVIILSVWNLKKRGIPLQDFEIGLVITVPLGILGASIFGKIFLPNMIWYHVFFFWEPGMSLFGSFFFGFIAAITWFSYRGQTTQISLWVYADCIVPNLLLGQMIGRWGNFYNHEILGNVTSYESLQWLPSFIRDRLFYFPNLSGFDLPNDWWTIDKLDESLRLIATSGPFEGRSLMEVLTSPELNDIDPKITPYGTILFRQPLFLIEGLGNLGLWIIINFGLSNLTHFWSKPKPWELQPKNYPGRFNKQYKALKMTELKEHQTQLPVRYYHPNNSTELVALTRKQAWNKAYYWYEPPLIEVERLAARRQEVRKKTLLQDQKQLKKTSRSNFSLKLKLFHLFEGNPLGRELEALHNPHQYRVLRAGVLTSSYFIGYLILRIILETQRTRAELMIPHHPIATFISLSLILILTFLLLVMAQWIAPYRYRETGWLYEKSY